MKDKKQIKELGETMSRVFDPYQPSLAIDIDGCVDEAPIFFQILTQLWPGKVFVISLRNNHEKTKAYLDSKRIRCDELVLVNFFEEKAEVIKNNGIMVFIDDQPEVLNHVREQCNVMLFRNGGNFDYEDKKWLFSENTGKLV